MAKPHIPHITTSACIERRRRSNVREAIRRDVVLRRSAGAVVLWMLGFALLRGLFGADGLAGHLLNQIVYLVPLVIAGLLMPVATARIWRARRADRLYWALLTASILILVVGEAFWSVAEVSGGSAFSVVTDACYTLAAITRLAAAVTVGRGNRQRSSLWHGLLDSAVLVAALGFAGWAFLARPLYERTSDIVAVSLDLAFPMLNVGVIMLLAAVVFARTRYVPVSLTFTSLALLAVTLTDLAYSGLALHVGEPPSGTWLNLGWQLHGLLLVLAAVVVLRHNEQDAEHRTLVIDPGLPIVLFGTLLLFIVVLIDAFATPTGPGTIALLLGSVVMLVTRLVIVSREHRQLSHRLEHSRAEQERLAVTDALTGVNNRRFFEELLSMEASRASRAGSSLSLVILDLDHFKQINDTYGHAAGDAVLQTAARRIRSMLSDATPVARYGGEEFVLLLPETDARQAAEIAEGLRRGLHAEPVPAGGRTYISVTASFGVSSMTAGDDIVESLVREADRALYAAKAAGRNRVCVAPQGDVYQAA